MSGLEVLESGYPRSWHFRQPEDVGAYADYHQWGATFRHLNGIQGKVLREELPDNPDEDARDWFTRFKRAHPEKLVMLHFNGKARRPSFHRRGFSPGHWLYYRGTTVTAEAGTGGTVLKVADPSVFSERRQGRPLPTTPDDIVIVARHPDGQLDWTEAEHVRLVGIDAEGSTISVRRAQFNSPAIDIRAGHYAAAHVRVKPPLLPDQVRLWCYNFSATGPRDPDNRRCIDVLADEIASWFDPDGDGRVDPLAGSLKWFDGLEFDVLNFLPAGTGFAPEQHLIDADNNGKADGVFAPDGDGERGPGFTGGINQYGSGVTEFCRLLRDDPRMSGKLILADGMHPEVHQRSFGILNGMESEGFPALGDPDFADWSGGLNRLEFWRRRGAAPRLSYQAYKYVSDQNKPGIDGDAYRRLRLALAAAVFTDSGFAQGEGWAPLGVPLNDRNDVTVRIFDELWRGRDQLPNWLGRPDPDQPAVHIAATAPDLFRGQGVPDTDPVTSADTAPDTGVPLQTVQLGPGPVELEGTDLFVEVELRGEPLAGYPQNARRYSVRALRPGAETPVAEILGWCDGQATTATFAFRDLGPGRFRIELRIEGNRPFTVVRATAHDHRDVMYREFPNGAVLANPSSRPYTFHLADLFPGRKFRRIAGQETQDGLPGGTNTGAKVGNRVEVGPIDGLFLVARDGRDGS